MYSEWNIHTYILGYSAKVDIWSLGCVVLEMFAGRRPWDSEQAIQAMFKVTNLTYCDSKALELTIAYCQLGAGRLAPPVPEDVKLSVAGDHFLSQCFIV